MRFTATSGEADNFPSQIACGFAAYFHGSANCRLDRVRKKQNQRNHNCESVQRTIKSTFFFLYFFTELKNISSFLFFLLKISFHFESVWLRNQTNFLNQPQRSRAKPNPYNCQQSIKNCFMKWTILTHSWYSLKHIHMSQDHPPHTHHSHSIDWRDGTGRDFGVHNTACVFN